jgi:hypothetical protein
MVRLVMFGMIASMVLGGSALAGTRTIPVTKDAGLDWRGWLNADQVWIYKGVGGCAAFYGDVLSQLTFPEAESVTIESATFNYQLLTSYEHSDPFTIQAFRITEDWSDATDPSYTGPAYAEGYGTVDTPLSGIISVDVTDLVQSWVDGTTTNYGVLLRDSDGWSACAIYSEEVGDWRPTFTVTYSIVLKPSTPVTIPITKDAGLDWRGWLNADQVWIYKGVGGCAAFYGEVDSYLVKRPGVSSTRIAYATLNYRLLNTYEHSDPFAIQAFRITEDWSDATDPNNTTGPAYAEGYGTVLSPLSGIISVDVTDLVRSWVAGTYPNYGVRIQDSEGWSACAIYSEEVGDWRPTFTVNCIEELAPNQNLTMTVPAIAQITVDGDISDWSDSSAWSQDYIYWAGATELTSHTKAQFAYNDAADMLYVAIQTDEASVQPGGHAVVGFSKDIYGEPISGLGSTQLCFDPVSGSSTVTVMNEIQYYSDKYSLYWGGGTTDGVQAAYSYNSVDGTYTYEIAIPLWADWQIGEPKAKQSLNAGDVVYLYSCLESGLETGIGMNLTWNGALSNPEFFNGAFDKAAALTLGASTLIPGDANGDGMVDVGDLGILAANYGGSGNSWSQGDFNGDGLVDVGDLGILAANYGTNASSADWSVDYAQAFGTTVEEDVNDDAEDTASSVCSGLGLPIVVGLTMFGLMLVKLEE